MRYKARAWSKLDKKWYDRVLVGCDSKGTDHVCHLIFDNEVGDWVPFDEFCGTVVMWTGLRDKNGKEIYEGDILDCTCESLTNFGRTRTGKFTTTYYEILWNDEGWGKKVLKSELLVVGKVSDGVSITAKYSVVVGNIYETPELLGRTAIESNESAQ